MTPYMEDRIRRIANHVVQYRCTVREAASHLYVSKSTVHTDITKRLPKLDPILFAKAFAVLEHNKAVRHLRGGEATRRKWLRKRGINA